MKEGLCLVPPGFVWISWKGRAATYEVSSRMQLMSPFFEMTLDCAGGEISSSFGWPVLRASVSTRKLDDLLKRQHNRL
jgi:hypothetical protein